MIHVGPLETSPPSGLWRGNEPLSARACRPDLRASWSRLGSWCLEQTPPGHDNDGAVDTIFIDSHGRFHNQEFISIISTHQAKASWEPREHHGNPQQGSTLIGRPCQGRCMERSLCHQVIYLRLLIFYLFKLGLHLVEGFGVRPICRQYDRAAIGKIPYRNPPDTGQDPALLGQRIKGEVTSMNDRKKRRIMFPVLSETTQTRH